MATSVTIHFWRGSGFIGTAIRLFSWGPVSHVAMQIGNDLYEAREFRGVVKSRYPVSKRMPDESFKVELPHAASVELVRQWWEKRIGASYDYLSVIRFVYRRSETQRTRGKWFCSEAVVDALSAGGVQLYDRLDSSKITPAMVYWSPLLIDRTGIGPI